MLFQTFPDFFFQYYHKAHQNIAYSIENSLPQLAAKFFPQKGANLKSKKAHCGMLSEVVLRMTVNWVIQMATDGQGGAAHSQMV